MEAAVGAATLTSVRSPVITFQAGDDDNVTKFGCNRVPVGRVWGFVFSITEDSKVVARDLRFVVSAIELGGGLSGSTVVLRFRTQERVPERVGDCCMFTSLGRASQNGSCSNVLKSI